MTDWRDNYRLIDKQADEESGDDELDAYQIGMRDGFSDAVALIDRLTGGDGEYGYSTIPGRLCADPNEMIARILERFE